MNSLIRSCFLINKTYPALKSANPLPLIYLLLIGLLFCFISTTLFAATTFLQDNAHVVSAEMASKLEKELEAIESRDGLHFEVVILPNFYNRDPQAVVDAYTQELAKNSANIDKRVLLLMVLDNKLAIIRPSSNIAAAYNEATVKEIIDNIKKNMDEKKYDEMTRIGIAGIYHYYEKQFPSAKQETSNKWKKYSNLGVILATLVLVIILITSLQKKKQNP